MNKFIGALSSAWWTGYASMGAAWIIAFAMPVVSFLTFTIALVFCDLISGTMAARKRKEKIHSRGLRRTVEKIALYFMAILLAQGMKEVFMPAAPLAYIVAFPIALTEFKSNIENVEVVTGVNVWNRIKNQFTHIKK